MICRDVSKAFDKVWHLGLKFKILQLQLPDILEKILCNFLDNRTAQIKMNNLLSEKFPLKSGVPQGSILSPTLYIFYPLDIPGPRHGGMDIMFADDVTQLVEYHRRSKSMLPRRTEREIDRINNFGEKWKIRTNRAKFKVLSILASKPKPISIDGNNIEFSNKINILRFSLERTGFRVHIGSKIAIA